MWWWETRGVHGLEPWDVFLGQERVLQRLDKVEVLNSALWTGNCLTVVREEVESLFRVNDELSTGVALQKQVSPKNISHTWKNIYLEPIGAAGDRGEDVVAVHGAQDQLGAVPDLATVGVPALEPGAPSLQTAHTDSREVTNTTLGLYLDTDITVTCFQNNPI